MKIAWITPKWPFPATDGARIATTQLLKNIAQHGIKIHLISIVSAEERPHIEEARNELEVDCVTLIHRKKTSRIQQLFSLFKNPFFPITLSPYSTSEVAEQILEILQSRRFDLTVYDGLHAAAWKFATYHGKLSRNSEAYRAHNVESEIWFRASKETKNPFKKWFLIFQGMLVKRVETRVAKESHFVFPVSLSDEEKFKTYRLNAALKTIPIGIAIKNKTEVKHTISEKKKILFVGKLDWPPNRDGLQWVLQKAWPKVMQKTKDLSLIIVGSGERAWLEPYRKLPGIEIVGRVDDLAPYYEDCIATIVPVFYGSGTRVKAIESSLYGRVCISTQIGVEGIGLVDGQNYFRVESAEEWVNTLISIQSERALSMGENAREFAQKAYDPNKIAESFIDAVRAV